jgi:CIC family chloride channel protein
VPGPDGPETSGASTGRSTVAGDPTLPVAAVLGVIIGLAVFGFEWLVSGGLGHVLAAPLAVMVVAPAAGLVAATVAVRLGPPPRSRSTADEYILSSHDPTRRIRPATVVSRMVAAVATLGSGGALGLEGPAVLMGAGVADAGGRRIGRRVRVDRQALLTAGAAAAVAAVFKAPATGAIFALEVPYRSDLARHRLLPALVGAATGYVALVSAAGTERLFPVADNPPFDLRDLGGALALGVVAGLLARVIARSVKWAKHWAASTPAWVRLPLAGVVLAAVVRAVQELTGAPLGLGPGYLVLDWIDDPGLGVWLVLGVLVLRFVAVIATTAGGGVGGYFIPLVVLGGLLGRLAGGLVGSPSALFPVLGVAAVLGAGYQVPLAAVMFVAETSGRPGYVVPALLAAVAADLAVGSQSVTDHQRAER